MLQRVQSLCLFFSGIISLLILVYAPILELNGSVFVLKDFKNVISPGSLLFSATLSIYTIFQYRRRKLQMILTKLARLLILVCIVSLFLQAEEHINIRYGFYLILIPFLMLLLAGYFIKKDEDIVRSADRIR